MVKFSLLVYTGWILSGFVPLRGTFLLEILQLSHVFFMEIPHMHLLLLLHNLFFHARTNQTRMLLLTNIFSMLVHIYNSVVVVPSVLEKELNLDLKLSLQRKVTLLLNHTATFWRDFRFYNGTVKCEANIAYGDEGRFQSMDYYYRPAESSTSGSNGSQSEEQEVEDTPVLVGIHGGGWVSGSKSHLAGSTLMMEMANRGWKCFSINYRLSSAKHVKHPNHIDDVKAAIRFIRANHKRFKIHPTRSFFAVMGGSAGGHLAALAALTPTCMEETIDACVPLYGVFNIGEDFGVERGATPWQRFGSEIAGVVHESFLLSDDDHYHNQKKRFNALWRFLLLGEKQERITRESFHTASPIDNISSNHSLVLDRESPPPDDDVVTLKKKNCKFLFLHGKLDCMVSYKSTEEMVARMKKEKFHPPQNIHCAILPLTVHAFDIINGFKSKIVHTAIETFLTDCYQQHSQHYLPLHNVPELRLNHE